MISFYPGPSQVHDRVAAYVREAQLAGILSMNHRSPACMALVKKTISVLKQKLNVPKSYTVLFLSSATECWEVLAQSLVVESSTHLYNGAFGKKWFSYTQALKPGATAVVFHREEELPVASYQGEVLCITQNETSNGTQVSMPVLKKIRFQNPHALLAIDATSSMGGQVLDFSIGDVWFASVQKCFGLPAGLAVMICSPRAVQRVQHLNERAHYNSLVNQLHFAANHQTTHTPNVLGIYLLYRVLQDSTAVQPIYKRLRQQAATCYAQLTEAKNLQPLIQNPAVRSDTVIAVTASVAAIKRTKAKAKRARLLLGEGYGELKHSTFRVANFPAIKPAAFMQLLNVLKNS
ncbi:MAG: alanine--glyoxylate aminotransferase family protein [Cyclobacteriaceae bacterium]|nr:alanine--glyoxylate aminotransferase family protein [Cyclobacteriaceae bacterium]